MGNEQHEKLILAVLQGDDYDRTVSQLNQAGFFVTLLSSSGGFMKRRSTTVMIGVEEAKLDQVLDILKRCAGRRVEKVYQNIAMPHGAELSAMPPIPMDKQVGGTAVFVLNLERMEKF